MQLITLVANYIKKDVIKYNLASKKTKSSLLSI